MTYGLYKIRFKTGIHIGKGTLHETGFVFKADTLFSALCIEAVKDGGDCLKELIDATNNGDLVISDAMPFIGERYFVPKPIIHIEQKRGSAENASGKAFKGVSYINVEDVNKYMSGEFNPDEGMRLAELGQRSVRDVVSIRGLEESHPYRVGVFHYAEESGLYVIAGYTNEAVRKSFEKLFDAVSVVGIGGKRQSGLGKFDIERQKHTDNQLKGLTGEFKSYMLLSAGLPEDDCMEDVLKDASYKLSVRRGFIQSATYSNDQLRKKDAYLIDSGSVVKKPFSGRVLDVSSGGSHPVYRYAKPMFLGVVE